MNIDKHCCMHSVALVYSQFIHCDISNLITYVHCVMSINRHLASLDFLCVVWVISKR